MATLQKIRNNAGLLVSIVIGLALLAFILGDLFRSNNSMSAQANAEIGEIGGDAVSIQQFQAAVDENIANYKRNTGKTSLDQTLTEQIREQTWNQIIREYLMVDAYKALGIGVSPEELFDMVQGNNIDPQVMQIPIFKNQTTGMFDRTLVIQFLKNMELDPSGDAQTSWNAFEKSLVQQKEDQKYNTLVEKGLFVTTIQAKRDVMDKNLRVDFDYVKLRYNSVSDSVITVTNKDLQDYYNKNIDKYQQEESRDINYVVFAVVPSATDDKNTKEWVENLKQEFSTIDNAEQYVNLNSDFAFDSKYYGKDELPENLKSLFSAETNTVLGTYKMNDSYRISKVANVKTLSDSVKARHILLRPANGVDVEAKADSLLNVIKKKNNFAELAKKYSEDGSASSGGDLGWFKFGAMVQSFNDACFFGKKGDLVIVKSQFGIHIVEILNQSAKSKKVQIATIARVVEPSTETYQQIYAKASKFGGTNRTYDAFKNSAEKEKLNLRAATVKREDKNLATLENPRQLIRWVYKANKGDVSDIFELGDKFVVATVRAVNEEGDSPLASVTIDVEREVKKIKKAEYLSDKMAKAMEGTNTLQSIADNLDTPLKEVLNTTFAMYSISGLGFEPEVQATVVEMPVDEISKPIQGKSGVFVVQVKNINKPKDDLNIINDKNYLTRSYRSRVGYQVYDAVKKAANIVDNRANFY
jgi:peptidyl-prolyl cis-trans isomerase D